MCTTREKYATKTTHTQPRTIRTTRTSASTTLSCSCLGRTFVRVGRHDIHGTNDFPYTAFSGMRRLRLSRGVLFGAVGSLSFFFVEIIQDGRQLVKHGAGGGGEVTGQKGWQWQNGSGGFVVQRYFGKASGDFDVRSLFLCFVALAVLFLFSLLLLLLSFFVGQFTDAMDGLSAGHELAIDVDQHCHWRKKKKQKEGGKTRVNHHGNKTTNHQRPYTQKNAPNKNKTPPPPHCTLTWVHKSSATFVTFGFFQIIAIVIVVLVEQISFLFGAFQNPILCFGQLPHGVVLAGTHVIDATTVI